MHNTIAFSGGFRYRPTTSTSFSSKRMSLESLKVLTLCGLSPRADQIRCTVAGETPCAFASDRQLQCVSPLGFVWSVACTIASTFSVAIDTFRPRPARTTDRPFSPSCANRSRHAVTVVGETPTCIAIAVFGSPWHASTSARARCTSRWGAVADFDNFSSTSRSASTSVRAGVGERMPHSTTKPHLFARHYTSGAARSRHRSAPRDEPSRSHPPRPTTA